MTIDTLYYVRSIEYLWRDGCAFLRTYSSKFRRFNERAPIIEYKI